MVDRESADDPEYARPVDEADWVYLGGGYAQVALPILQGTKVMDSVLHGKQRGALISGASAGAMMMGDRRLSLRPNSWKTSANTGRVARRL